MTAELSQPVLGLLRRILEGMEPNYVVELPDRKKFWKEQLFDFGVAPRVIEIMVSYEFRWGDIISDLFVGKFGPQNEHFSNALPPYFCEQTLKRLLALALHEGRDRILIDQLAESLDRIGFKVEWDETPREDSQQKTNIPQNSSRKKQESEAYTSLAETAKALEPNRNQNDWDFFISHASEDKDAIAQPLAETLRAKGKKVWYDDFSLKVGDSLHESIDHGLARSNFGIVILSSHFFEKHWPKKELDGLAAREVNRRKVILPIWHEVGFNEVREYSPTLADRVAVSTDKGLEYVVEKILDSADAHTPTPIVQPAAQRERIVFEESVYWKVGGDSQKEGPYCPNCYDDRRKEIHLIRGATRGTYACGVCGNSFTTDEYDSRPAKRRPFSRRRESTQRDLTHSHEPFEMQHVFVGQFPDGPKLRLTATRRFAVTQVEYLDENGVRVASENMSLLNVSRLVSGKGQQLEVPINHAKLIKIHNLKPRMGTAAIPIQLRVHLSLDDGSEEIRTISTLLRPGFKNIGNTPTYFMDVIG